MGLDAWFYASEEKFVTDPEDAGAIVPVSAESSKNTFEVGYFRKFHPLQEYMSNLYCERGGQDGVFNCKKVQLYEHDFKDLLEAAMTETLMTEPMPAEFIFYYKTELLIIVHSATQLLKDGFTVYYDSWW